MAEARKQVKALKKKLAVEEKETKKARQAVKRVRKQAARKIAAEKKKKVRVKKVVRIVRKKGLGTYQYFMRQQLREGKTFEQAARAWKKFKAYVKKGRLPTKIVRAKPQVRVVTRTRVKTVRVPVPSTEAGMFKNLLHELREVKKRVQEKPVPAEAAAEAAAEALRAEARPEPVPVELSAPAPETAGVSEEEQAFGLVKLYLADVARHGFKRGLDLDQVINAYLYALGRVKRREIEAVEVLHAAQKH